MTRLISCCTVVGALLLIAGCVIARDVQLYPDNAAVHALGPLHARIVGHGNLNGTATMGLPNGQLLEGRYSISHGGGFGVDSVYASVYGPGGSASRSAVGTSTFDTLQTAPQVLEPLTSRPLVSRHVRDLS